MSTRLEGGSTRSEVGAAARAISSMRATGRAPPSSLPLLLSPPTLLDVLLPAVAPGCCCCWSDSVVQRWAIPRRMQRSQGRSDRTNAARNMVSSRTRKRAKKRMCASNLLSRPCGIFCKRGTGGGEEGRAFHQPSSSEEQTEGTSEGLTAEGTFLRFASACWLSVSAAVRLAMISRM